MKYVVNNEFEKEFAVREGEDGDYLLSHSSSISFDQVRLSQKLRPINT